MCYYNWDCSKIVVVTFNPIEVVLAEIIKYVTAQILEIGFVTKIILLLLFQIVSGKQYFELNAFFTVHEVVMILYSAVTQ